MSKYNKFRNYNPDILETIANLSNDEVFTPPKLANDILDLLPKEIWSDSKITFLDPATKTGIFLREITSRLIAGLAEEIPDLQTRVNHILTKQVFGIGITELTTLMARRTVYCSTTANGEYSICTEFDNADGNIVFPPTEHTFNEKTGRCEYCGANAEGYDREEGLDNYAYSFIHDDIKEVFGNMKFDVIIGNPPYQLNVGNEGGNSAKSSALYHLFVEKAIELEPKYISMIIPSRWMTRTADGIPKLWIDKVIDDKRFKEMHDFANSEDCFSGVSIRGGVNYFLWDSEYSDKCIFNQHLSDGKIKTQKLLLNTRNSGVVVRDIDSLSILDKISNIEVGYIEDNSMNFYSMVSPKDFFTTPKTLTSNWKDFSRERDKDHDIRYYISKHMNGIDVGWVKESDVLRNQDAIKLHKVYINAAGHNEKFGPVLGKPFYGTTNSVCSQTYLVIGYDDLKHNFTKEECFNIISYIETKFFRFMVDMKKSTQNCARGVYQFVPLQDFSKPWTDEELYTKYELTDEEIAYIEDNIDPMGDIESPDEDFDGDFDDEEDITEED